MKVCSRCILDSNVPNITFDEHGVCNYCSLHDKWEQEYSDGEKQLLQIINDIKQQGKDQRYDCIVGISGGCDSSYLLYKAKEFGLNPLTVHFNNNWNTEIAEFNMRKMVSGLNVDYFEMGVDKEEYDDICRSFLLASVPDADIPNDIALTTVLYLAATKFGVKYILGGHSFRTEGTTPLGWSYMDGKYVADVQAKFGRVPLQTFENLWMRRWLYWMIMKRIKRPRLLWYMDYDKEKAKKLLHEKLDWDWYGSAHCENKYTSFISNYVQPRKFGIDLRYVLLSARVRSGFLTREQALAEVSHPPAIEEEIVKEVKKRLRFTEREFEQMMLVPRKTHFDYNTYHPTFKRYKLFFQLASKLELVPKTFYEKYTK